MPAWIYWRKGACDSVRNVKLVPGANFGMTDNECAEVSLLHLEKERKLCSPRSSGTPRAVKLIKSELSPLMSPTPIDDTEPTHPTQRCCRRAVVQRSLITTGSYRARDRRNPRGTVRAPVVASGSSKAMASGDSAPGPTSSSTRTTMGECLKHSTYTIERSRFAGVGTWSMFSVGGVRSWSAHPSVRRDESKRTGLGRHVHKVNSKISSIVDAEIVDGLLQIRSADHRPIYPFRSASFISRGLLLLLPFSCICVMARRKTMTSLARRWNPSLNWRLSVSPYAVRRPLPYYGTF